MEKESPRPSFPAKSGDVFLCDEEWLSKALGLSVKNVEFKPLTPGNTGPTLSRISMLLDDEKSHSVVAKYCSAAEMKSVPMGHRLFASLINFDPEFVCEKEVFFYEHLQPRLLFLPNFLAMPRCHSIAFKKDSAPNMFASLFDMRSNMRMLLLMQDLSSMYSQSLGSVIASDLAGLTAVRILARSHATLMHSAGSLVRHSSSTTSLKESKKKAKSLPESQSGASDPALEVLQMIPEKFRETTNFSNVIYPRGGMFRMSVKMVLSDSALRGLADKWSSHALVGPIFQNEDVLAMLQVISKKILLKLEKVISRADGLFQHHTLLHGDCHMANIFFPCSHEDFILGKFDAMYLIDWQMFGIGCPSFEVVYFMSNIRFSKDLYLNMRDEYYLELTKHLSEHHRSSYTKEIFDLECDVLASYQSVGMLMFLCASDHKAVDEMLEKSDHDKQTVTGMVVLMQNMFQVASWILPKLLEREAFQKYKKKKDNNG